MVVRSVVHSEPVNTLARAAYLAQRMRDCLALAHHEGYQAGLEIDFGKLTTVLKLTDDYLLGVIKELAKKYPEDLQH